MAKYKFVKLANECVGKAQLTLMKTGHRVDSKFFIKTSNTQIGHARPAYAL